MTYLEDMDDSTISALSKIADPFVIRFMSDKKYSEQEAFKAYAQEANRQGFSHCTDDQFSRGFRLSCFIMK